MVFQCLQTDVIADELAFSKVFGAKRKNEEVLLVFASEVTENAIENQCPVLLLLGFIDYQRTTQKL